MMKTSFASEFSGDDEDYDVTYTPSNESKKRKVFNGDGKQFVKGCMENTFGNIIFTSNFYIEVKKISENKKDKIVGKCVACNKVICGFMGVSSNFISHLRVRHPEIHKEYLTKKSNKQNLSIQSNFEFSGDDEDFDITYTPSKESKKGKVFSADGEQFVKGCMENTFGNIIFTSNFYIEVKKISENKKDKIVGKCVACNKVICGFMGVSSNFISHLRVRHPEIHKEYLTKKSNKQNLSIQSNFEFSGYDEDFDVTYTPSKESKKRKVFNGDGEQHVEGCMENTSGNIIFTSNFYIEVKKISENKKGKIVGKCVACYKVISGFMGVSSNFISHLRVRHPEIHKEYLTKKSNKQNLSIQSNFDNNLIKFLVDSGLPLSLVARQPFINLFEGIGLKLMSKQTAMKKLEEQHKRMEESVRAELATAKHVCTTADIWSGNNRSFFRYTCHWLDKDFKRKSAALACKRMFGVYSAEKIGHIMTDINTYYGLDRKNIVLSVTDNGSNFVKAFKEYGVESAPEMEEDEGHDMSEFQNQICVPKHHRFSSHTLSLLVTSDLIKILKADESLFNLNNMVFKKCDNLWKKCKWPKSSEVVQETLGGCLVVPDVTRWNSLYDAVVRLLQHRPKLDELCDKLSLPRFTSWELSYLDAYKLIVAPIAQSLDFMQDEQSVGYGCLLPTIVTLSNKLIKIQQKVEHPFSRIVLELEKQLRQRFRAFFELNEEADLALAAATLIPNVKLSWLKILQKTSPQFTYALITERVIRIITDYAIKQNLPATNENHKCEGSYTESTFYDFSDGEESTALLSEEAESLHLITNMMHQYLNDTDKTSNIWCKYPTLKEIALFCNTPLTSLGPVERLFSFAGIVNSPTRDRLTDFSFEKLVLLKANSY